MSNIYHAEPPTQGKVLIKTSYGDIDVELWSKEAPLACRNFIQLALEGQYDNTLVHRVIKGFMAQMGDPSGTGRGGSSIWDKPFKDEVHGRIRFNHRGQVAMANENKPHSNKSQFFITLDACEWLNGKHTIFGKVTGSTIFNVLRLNDVEVGEEDRPLEPIRVIGVDVLWNPFDDIVPRDLSGRRENNAAPAKVDTSKKERKAVRDSKLLSFGDGDEDADTSFVQGKARSLHDSKLRDKRMSAKTAEELQSVAAVVSDAARESRRHKEEDKEECGAAGGGSAAAQEQESFEARMKAQTRQRLARSEARRAGAGDRDASNGGRRGSDGSDDESDRGEEQLDSSAMARLAASSVRQTGDLREKSAEYSKLKEGLMRSRRAVNVLTGGEAEALRQESAFREMISPLEQRRAKYMKRKSEFGDRSAETLAKLQKFTQSIRHVKKEVGKTTGTATGAGASTAEAYHGQVLERDSGDEGGAAAEEDLSDWHVGQLKFKKHIDDRYRMQSASGGSGSDGRNADDYTVVDTRLSSTSGSSSSR